VWQLKRHRVVTLVGAGGVGKTTVAIASAAGAVGQFSGGACVVSLASAIDAASTLAEALGIPPGPEAPGQRVLERLANRSMLLLLDSCESVAGGAASLVDDLGRQAPGVRLLATSRQPLGVADEQLVRLAPFSLPDDGVVLTVEQALKTPAVEMFVDRARSVLPDFRLTHADVPGVLEICRRVDGLPLAIEMVVSRIDVFGIDGLLNLLRTSPSLPHNGRRTVVARHRTLEATLDWSYRRLSQREKTVLQQVATLPREFTSDSAAASFGPAGMRPTDVAACLSALADKSWLEWGREGSPQHYRILSTTRAYAIEKAQTGG
jgi:predicted ATPase